MQARRPVRNPPLSLVKDPDDGPQLNGVAASLRWALFAVEGSRTKNNKRMQRLWKRTANKFAQFHSLLQPPIDVSQGYCQLQALAHLPGSNMAGI